MTFPLPLPFSQRTLLQYHHSKPVLQSDKDGINELIVRISEQCCTAHHRRSAATASRPDRRRHRLRDPRRHLPDSGLIARRIGVLRLCRYSIDPYVDSGALELLPENWVTAPLPVNVVYPQHRHLSAKVRVFVEWVADSFFTHPCFQIKAPARRTVLEKA
jgi:DNA-binding transcriptional LysR family regulator